MEVCFDNTHLTNNNETSAHQLKITFILYKFSVFFNYRSLTSFELRDIFKKILKYLYFVRRYFQVYFL